MAKVVSIEPANDRELALCRILAAPPTKLWRCWTEPELLKQCFCPKPWRVTEANLDLRAGGSSYILMEGPNGEKAPNRGIYLEVDAPRKLVFTDAFTSAWQPSEKPFMIGTVTFEPHPEGTLYTARCGHWTLDDKANHAKMGFHEGWGIVAEQMEALARTL